MSDGKKHKRYSPEFKVMVVETMQREKLSYAEVTRRFEINNRGSVKSWERIYLEAGKEGLYTERRGRKTIFRSAKSEKNGEESLAREVQRLRAENAYLKN